MATTIYLPMDAMREIRIAVSRAVKANKLAVPAVSEADLFSHPLDIRLIDLEQVDGNTTLLEQILIVALAKRRDAQKGESSADYGPVHLEYPAKRER